MIPQSEDSHGPLGRSDPLFLLDAGEPALAATAADDLLLDPERLASWVRVLRAQENLRAALSLPCPAPPTERLGLLDLVWRQGFAGAWDSGEIDDDALRSLLLDTRGMEDLGRRVFEPGSFLERILEEALEPALQPGERRLLPISAPARPKLVVAVIDANGAPLKPVPSVDPALPGGSPRISYSGEADGTVPRGGDFEITVEGLPGDVRVELFLLGPEILELLREAVPSAANARTPAELLAESYRRRYLRSQSSSFTDPGGALHFTFRQDAPREYKIPRGAAILLVVHTGLAAA